MSDTVKKDVKPKSSRDVPAAPQKQDEDREMREAIVADAPETDEKDRDAVHGDGNTILGEDSQTDGYKR